MVDDDKKHVRTREIAPVDGKIPLNLSLLYITDGIAEHPLYQTGTNRFVLSFREVSHSGTNHNEISDCMELS